MPVAQPSTRSDEWLPARDAAALLGVSLGTLYSYVSRGLLHPVAAGGATRGKHYRRGELQRLAHRHAAVREPRRVAGAALDFGLPVLASSLCLIESGRLYYRGHEAVQLADHASLEDIAALLWDCPLEGLVTDLPPLTAELEGLLSRTASLPIPLRMLSAFHGLADAWSAQPHADGAPSAAWRWVQAMRVAATGRTPAPWSAPLHRQLGEAWGLDEHAADELRRALVLCADHELNASSFTARCVASTGANPSVAVAAALAALTGPRHGGVTATVEVNWRRLSTAPAAPPGFGHALYPDGDPRGRYLLERLPRRARRERLIDAVQQRSGLAPSLDFGLVALRRWLGAPMGAAFAIFAIGRTVGWLAHVFEQQRNGGLIRPRADYIGPRPERPPAESGRVIRRR